MKEKSMDVKNVHMKLKMNINLYEKKQIHNGKLKIQYVQCHYEGNTKSALNDHTANGHKGRKFQV